MSDDGRQTATNAVLVIVGALAGLLLVVLSIVSLGLAGQLSYFIMATFDNSVWTDETKFVDGNATAGVKTKFYEAAEVQVDKDLERIQLALNAASIAVGLIGVLIIVVVFFLPKTGVLAMIRNISK